MKTTIVIVAVILMGAPVWAAEDTPETRAVEADRYLAVMPPVELFEDMTDQMAASLPEDQRREFEDLMTRHLDIPALEKAMREALIRHFTADELKALADFYGSEVGKSAMAKFGVYMAELMPVIQTEIMKAQARAEGTMEEADQER